MAAIVIDNPLCPSRCVVAANALPGASVSLRSSLNVAARVARRASSDNPPSPRLCHRPRPLFTPQCSAAFFGFMGVAAAVRGPAAFLAGATCAPPLSSTAASSISPRAALFRRRSPQLVFANLGAAYGTAKAGVGIASMGIMHPSQVRVRWRGCRIAAFHCPREGTLICVACHRPCFSFLRR